MLCEAAERTGHSVGDGRLTAAPGTHSAALHNQNSAFGKHEQVLHLHEHSLAGFEKGGTGEDLIMLAKAHAQEAERQAHERIKKFHHGLLAEWNLLLNVVSKAI